MPYMLLIHEPIGQRQERGVTAGEAVYAQMLRFTESLQQRGLLIASSSLADTSSAVRLQVREGRGSIVDGPFAEAKEMVGGFFLLNTEDRELALAVATECPAANWCTVEVRPSGPCFQFS